MKMNSSYEKWLTCIFLASNITLLSSYRNMGIFDLRGHCDVTMGVTILKIYQNHHHKLISHAKISLNAKFRLHISLCSQVIEMGHF